MLRTRLGLGFKFDCNSLLFKRKFSATNLAKEEKIVSQISQSVKESPKEPPTVTISSSTPNSSSSTPNLSNIKSHKFFQLLQSQTLKTTDKFANLLRGPVRSNLLVSWELFKLIANEQKLVPELSSWPQARQSYIAVYDTFKQRLLSKEFTLEFFKEKLSHVTWGQVGRALRVSIEMAAFYYIGELAGLILSFPFK